MRRYLSLLQFSGLVLGQANDPEIVKEVSNQSIIAKESLLNQHNLSVGIFDDRTGLSFFGYTYNLKQTKMDEYFIGVGTLFFAVTGTVGWEHYYKKSRLSISSAVCGQWFFLTYDDYFNDILWDIYNGDPQITVSITLEYNVAKWVQINAGGVLGYDFEGDYPYPFPFVCLNFSF